MADQRTPITPENLKEVLARLNDVLEEAASLRKDVIRQLSFQGAGDRQHLNPVHKRKKSAKKR